MHSIIFTCILLKKKKKKIGRNQIVTSKKILRHTGQQSNWCSILNLKNKNTALTINWTCLKNNIKLMNDYADYTPTIILQLF